MNRVGEALQMKQHRQRLRGMKVEDKGLPGWHGLSTMGIMRSHEKKAGKSSKIMNILYIMLQNYIFIPQAQEDMTV